VTRLKSNAVYRRIEKRHIKEGGTVKSDYEIILPSLSKNVVLRKIIVCDPETNKKITLLTNNLQWSAKTISAIYKDRWHIELFFKAIKQNLKIKKFYGNSKNAVMTQIWIALIAYLLFYLIKQKYNSLKLSFTNFISVFKTMLFQRVSLYELLCLRKPLYKPKPTLQLSLEFI
jgi:putative transposase